MSLVALSYFLIQRDLGSSWNVIKIPRLETRWVIQTTYIVHKQLLQQLLQPTRLIVNP